MVESIGKNSNEHVPGKRRFLRAAGAGILMAAGVRATSEAEAGSGVFGYSLFDDRDKPEEQRRLDTFINKIKTQNTRAEFEKNLLDALSDDEIATINARPGKTREIIRNVRTNRWKETLSEAATTFVGGTGLGIGIGGGIGNKENNNLKVYGGIFGAAVGALAGMSILFAEPTREDADAAEEGIVKWVMQEKKLVGSISKQSILERIEDITTLQKKNSAKIADF